METAFTFSLSSLSSTFRGSERNLWDLYGRGLYTLGDTVIFRLISISIFIILTPSGPDGSLKTTGILFSESRLSGWGLSKRLFRRDFQLCGDVRTAPRGSVSSVAQAVIADAYKYCVG